MYGTSNEEFNGRESVLITVAIQNDQALKCIIALTEMTIL
jgi:hypothetical protein